MARRLAAPARRGAAVRAESTDSCAPGFAECCSQSCTDGRCGGVECVADDGACIVFGDCCSGQCDQGVCGDQTPPPTYPSGPYGFDDSDTLPNFEVQGRQTSSSPAGTIRPGDFYNPSDSAAGPAVLVISLFARWAPGGMQQEAQSDFGYWQGQRIAFLSLLGQGTNPSDPATDADLVDWLESFGSDHAAALDPQFDATGPLLDQYGGLPINLFVDTRTMRVLQSSLGIEVFDSSYTGFDPYITPQKPAPAVQPASAACTVRLVTLASPSVERWPPSRAALDALSQRFALHYRAALDADRAGDWLKRTLDARDDWTEDFDGEQFSLGRAFYTHLEQDKTGEYFADAKATNERVERVLPGAQGFMLDLLSKLVGHRVRIRSGWCGPGVHIFPPGEHVAQHGGVIHVDVEGLPDHHVDECKPALSLVVMLQSGAAGGGLRVWDVQYEDRDELAPDDPLIAEPSCVIDYGVGDAVVQDSYRLHQIQPFSGDVARVSLTAMACEVDPGNWECWF